MKSISILLAILTTIAFTSCNNLQEMKIEATLQEAENNSIALEAVLHHVENTVHLFYEE